MVEEPGGDAGIVFQIAPPLAWRTAFENVMMPVEALRPPRRDYEAKARDLLRYVRRSLNPGAQTR